MKLLVILLLAVMVVGCNRPTGGCECRMLNGLCECRPWGEVPSFERCIESCEMPPDWSEHTLYPGEVQP